MSRAHDPTRPRRPIRVVPTPIRTSALAPTTPETDARARERERNRKRAADRRQVVRLAKFVAKGEAKAGGAAARTNHRSQHEVAGRTRSDFVRVDPPSLTADTAYEFVKLLHSGLDAPHALAYLAPAYIASLAGKRAEFNTLVVQWARSPLVLDATTKLNGGAWHKLEPDDRLRIALDKHYAELAYFLYTHDFAIVDGQDLKKATDAREALAKKLEGNDGPGTPTDAFIKILMEQGAKAFDRPVQIGEPFPIPTRPKES